VAGMLIAVTLSGVFVTYRAANEAALSSHSFQTRLAEIVALKTQHPELPLLFYSTNVYHREPLVSVARFLAVRLPNPEKPFLWLSYGDEMSGRFAGSTRPGLEQMEQRLREISVEGDEFFAKISNFHGSNGRCIAVNFSGLTENFRCAYSVRIGES